MCAPQDFMNRKNFVKNLRNVSVPPQNTIPCIISLRSFSHAQFNDPGFGVQVDAPHRRRFLKNKFSKSFNATHIYLMIIRLSWLAYSPALSS